MLLPEDYFKLLVPTLLNIGYYYNFLPSWTCDRSNAYCETGSPDDFGQGCPALYGAAATLKQRVSTFLDDIFGA